MEKSESFLITKRTLIDVAMGRKDADLVIRQGSWVSVQSREIIPNIDIAIASKRIAYVGENADHTIGKRTQIVDASMYFLIPGLLDAHTHIESSNLRVSEFVQAVMPWGTTGIFIEPHELANVNGLKGVKSLVEEAKLQPIHVWVQMPSCVPAAPGLETPGASIGPEEVAEAMSWEGIIGLGEMMNFPGVFSSDEKLLAEMAESAKASKVIGGHYASPDLGLPFHGYVAGGAEDDHEGTRKEDALIRSRQGMKVMMRLGTFWYDVAEQLRAVTEDGLDPRNFILCTDDIKVHTLLSEGHMDRVVRHVIEQGLDPVTAIQMATINPAKHFGVDKDVGIIAPGRYADVILASDLEELKIDRVFAKGKEVASFGKPNIKAIEAEIEDPSLLTVNLPNDVTNSDFSIMCDKKSQVTANVIGIVENQAPTRHLKSQMEPLDGQLHADIPRDISKVAVLDRHTGSGNIKLGFVSGFGFNSKCAVASTFSHESQNIVVVGTDDYNMAFAVNTLFHQQGGIVVVKNNEVIGLLELAFGGVISIERPEIVSEKMKTIKESLIMCGCERNGVLLQIQLLTIAFIPELRITDLGVIDVTRLEITPLIDDENK